MIEYISTLLNLYHNTHLKPNHHMLMHVPLFLQLYGPTRSWWCFPYKWLIGQIQWLLSNHKTGQMESTLLHSFLKATRLQCWLSDPQSLPIFKEIKMTFNKYMIYTMTTQLMNLIWMSLLLNQSLMTWKHWSVSVWTRSYQDLHQSTRHLLHLFYWWGLLHFCALAAHISFLWPVESLHTIPMYIFLPKHTHPNTPHCWSMLILTGSFAIMHNGISHLIIQ